MAFGLLAGIAGAFPAIQAGMDSQKARDQADDDRKYTLEQRESARADRAFGLQQRDRTVAEQRRQDALKADLAAVPQTREIDTRPQAVREITVDDDGNPSATQIPAMKTVAAPDWMKFKSTADTYRKNQEFEKADAYDAIANKAQFADSAKRFQSLYSGSGSMTLEQLGSAAAEIYNNDPLPAQVEGMRPVAGGMQFKITNKDTGESQSMVVKDSAELLQRLEAYYSPDTYAAYQKSVRDARTKVAENMNDPSKRYIKGVDGNIFDAKTQKWTVGPGRQGMEPIGEDTDGNPIYRRTGGGAGTGGSGAGGGKAGKPAAQFGDISDVFKAVEGFSNMKTELSGQQGIEALRLARLFSTQEPGVDASVAAAAALRAAQDPSQVKPAFDRKTGRIMAGVQFEGGSFFVRPLGTPGKPGSVKPEEMKGIAADFISRMPDDQQAILLPAAFSKVGRAKLTETVASDMRSPDGLAQLQTFLRRKPTEADIADAIKASESTTQQTLDLIALHGDPALRKQFGDKPAPAPKVAPTGGVTPPGAVPAQAQGFGLGGAPLSKPERRKLVDAKVAEMRSAEEARVAELKTSGPAEAARLLADNTPQSRTALAKLQASEAFKYLDKPTQLAVWKRVNQGL